MRQTTVPQLNTITNTTVTCRWKTPSRVLTIGSGPIALWWHLIPFIAFLLLIVWGASTHCLTLTHTHTFVVTQRCTGHLLFLTPAACKVGVFLVKKGRRAGGVANKNNHWPESEIILNDVIEAHERKPLSSYSNKLQTVLYLYNKQPNDCLKHGANIV